MSNQQTNLIIQMLRFERVDRVREADEFLFSTRYEISEKFENIVVTVNTKAVVTVNYS